MQLPDISTILSEKWLPNLVGIIGGLLGAYAFIDNYILRFKPKIFAGSQVFFQLGSESRNGWQEVDYILLSIEIGNHRKKYGLIYDLAVRYYVSGEINPNTVIYYASEMAENIKLENKKAVPENILPFKPLAILPNSDKSINLLLGDVVNRSKDSISRGQHYDLELYYQTNPKGKWKFVSKSRLYNTTRHGEKESDVQIPFTTLDLDVSRGEIKHFTKPIATSGVYKGALDKENHWKKQKLTNRFTKKPVSFFKNTVQYISRQVQFVRNDIVDRKFRWPVILQYFKNPKRQKWTIGHPELKHKVFEALYKLHEILSEKAALLNPANEQGNDLVLKKNSETEFIISRYQLSLKVYISNDKDIRVHGEGSYSKGRFIRYNLELRKGMFNHYYYLENYGPKTLESFAFIILDTIALQS
jgi:hypothetical protein